MLPRSIGGPAGCLGLSPEFILGVFVTLKLAKLYRATVSNSPKVHLQKFRVLTGSGRTHRTQNENGRVTRNYIVQLDPQRTPRQIHTFLKKAEHLFMANVV